MDPNHNLNEALPIHMGTHLPSALMAPRPWLVPSGMNLRLRAVEILFLKIQN